MNATSSRSHSLFTLILQQKSPDGSIKTGKLNLADLAGSEKVGKTGAAGETLEEAKKINQSLSALGNCINALTKQKRGHVPFRDSKLTFILRESLGGNSKTTLVVNCSPDKFNIDETVSFLLLRPTESILTFKAVNTSVCPKSEDDQEQRFHQQTKECGRAQPNYCQAYKRTCAAQIVHSRPRSRSAKGHGCCRMPPSFPLASFFLTIGQDHELEAQLDSMHISVQSNGDREYEGGVRVDAEELEQQQQALADSKAQLEEFREMILAEKSINAKQLAETTNLQEQLLVC